MLPAFFTSFVTHTSLNIQVLGNIPLDASSKFITVTVGDRSLSVQCPVRVTVLLQSGVCPVLDITSSRFIIHLEVVFIVVPVFTSREQIYTSQRVEQESGSSLILHILVGILGAEVNVNILQDIKSHFRIQVMAAVGIAWSHTFRVHITIREVRLDIFITTGQRDRVVCCKSGAIEFFRIVRCFRSQFFAPAVCTVVADSICILEFRKNHWSFHSSIAGHVD